MRSRLPALVASRWGSLLLVAVVTLGVDLLVVPRLAGAERGPWLTAYVRFAHEAGNGAVLAAIGVGLWLVGLGGRRRLERGGVWLLQLLLLTGFWTHVFKRLVGRPRPRFALAEGTWWPAGPSLVPSLDSFPSGHAMGSFAVATLLGAIFPRGRWIFFGLAAVIALGRVFGGDHYLSDILVGGWLGWVLGGYAARRWSAEVGDAAA